MNTLIGNILDNKDTSYVWGTIDYGFNPYDAISLLTCCEQANSGLLESKAQVGSVEQKDGAEDQSQQITIVLEWVNALITTAEVQCSCCGEGLSQLAGLLMQWLIGKSYTDVFDLAVRYSICVDELPTPQLFSSALFESLCNHTIPAVISLARAIYRQSLPTGFTGGPDAQWWGDHTAYPEQQRLLQIKLSNGINYHREKAIICAIISEFKVVPTEKVHTFFQQKFVDPAPPVHFVDPATRPSLR